MRNEKREVYKASKTINSRLGKEQIKFIPLNTNDRYFEKLLGLKDVDIPNGQNTKHFTHEKIEKRENYLKSIEHRVYSRISSTLNTLVSLDLHRNFNKIRFELISI